MIGEKLHNDEERPKEIVIEDRRFSRDEKAVEEPAAERKDAAKPAAAETPKDAAEPSAGPEGQMDILDLGIDNFLKYVMSLSMALVWIYLGLQADPKTGLVAKDLTKASTCIDAIEWIYARYKNEYPPEERSEIEHVIRDIKLNFISAGAPN